MTSPTTATASGSRRLQAFVVILARTSGAEALAAGLTPYLALLILCGVIFGGNGMHPGELTALARASLGFRLSLLAAWLLISMPAARAMLASRSTFYLRCMPVPSWTVVPVLMAYMVLVEVSWCWLWLVGEGPAGAGAVAVAIAGHAFMASRPSRPSEIAGALATLGLITTTGTLAVWNAVGWPLAAFAVWRAWSTAPGRGLASTWAVVRRGQPRLVALAAAHSATLFRRHRPLLFRWLWLAGAGALSGVLAVRNNRLDGAAAQALWLTCLVPGLLFGAAGIGSSASPHGGEGQLDVALLWGLPGPAAVGVRSLAAPTCAGPGRGDRRPVGAGPPFVLSFRTTRGAPPRTARVGLFGDSGRHHWPAFD